MSKNICNKENTLVDAYEIKCNDEETNYEEEEMRNMWLNLTQFYIIPYL